jgi:hypothetical protein
LGSLEDLPSTVQFNNGLGVYLKSLTSISPGTEFNNGSLVSLASVKRIPRDVKFNNEGDVWLGSLTRGHFSRWAGNIEGISPRRLLEKMVSIGIFDREK